MESGIWASGASWEEVTHEPPRVTEKKKTEEEKKNTPEKIEFMTPSLPQVTVLAEASNSGTFRALFWKMCQSDVRWLLSH